MRSVHDVRVIAVSVALGSLALAASACRPPEPEYLTDADRAAIQAATDSAMAIANTTKDWEAYADTYFAPDAIVMPPNQEAVLGREGIAVWLGTLPPMEDVTFQIEHEEGSGDMAFVQGTYSATVTRPGTDQTTMDRGHYLEVWKRQIDGGWRVAFYITNSDTPEPGAYEPMPGVGAGGGQGS